MGEDTKSVTAVDVKPGSYIIFDGKACVVKDVQKSKPGKHGHAKCRISAVSIVDDAKIIKIMPGHDRVEVPLIQKRDAQALSIANGKVNIMDSETFETFDLPIPDEFKDQIKEGVNIHYWLVLGQKVIKAVK
ncbi:MAG TPA: translation initiation factor IF-5A [Candidatus Nanoarchaeia archaeon]|nr:translation initiation factor IF-5A [Candidatus Nanoarchaeia archaeon]